MKIQRLYKTSLIVSLSVAGLLFIAQPSTADQPEGTEVPVVMPEQSPETGQAVVPKEESYPEGHDNITRHENIFKRMMSSSKEVKVSVNERLQAFLSLGSPAVYDLAGKKVNQNFRAVVGFHIPLQD